MNGGTSHMSEDIREQESQYAKPRKMTVGLFFDRLPLYLEAFLYLLACIPLGIGTLVWLLVTGFIFWVTLQWAFSPLP